MNNTGLLDRLEQGETIICADGCRSELVRRGFLRDGDVTCNAALNFPRHVRQLHQDFVHCGSDVVVSCNGHNMETMMNAQDDSNAFRESMKIARSVALDTDTLMAGCLNSTGFNFDETATKTIKQLFERQVQMIVDEGAYFILGQMFTDTREARLALDIIKEHGKGLPSVMTFFVGQQGKTTDGIPIPEAMRLLESLGANVVGLACNRGPSTLIPLIREAKALCKGPLAAIPTAYRTSPEEVTIRCLTDPLSSDRLFPRDLDQALCNRKDITNFAQEVKSLGIQFIGLCCGTYPCYIREMADVYGRQTPSSKFSLDLLKTSIHLPNPSPHRVKIRSYQIPEQYRKEQELKKSIQT